jgi:pimeloyl-ACP methyl ester carboxylesterase
MSSYQIVMRRGYTSCRYGQMHYLEGTPAHADVSAPTLVMLHQNPSSSFEYEPLIKLMATDRRVIAFDTPGYGMSDYPPGPLSIAQYAAAICDAADAMSLSADGPVDVFGFHTGTLLTAEFGLQRPDLAARLVMCGVPWRTPEECAERLAAARNVPVATDDGEAVLAQSAALYRYVVTQRLPGIDLRRAVELYAEKNKPLDRCAWAYEGVWSYPFAERFPLITQPCLFPQPDDALVSQCQAVSKVVPNGAYVELPSLERDVLEVGVGPLAEAMRAFLTPRSA